MAALPPPIGLTRAEHTHGHPIERYTIPYVAAINAGRVDDAAEIKRRVMDSGEFNNDQWKISEDRVKNNPIGGRRKRKRKTNKRKSRRRRKSSKRRRKPKRKTHRRRRRR